MRFSNTALGQLTAAVEPRALDSAEARLTAELRKYAAGAGWPAELLGALKVTNAGGKLTVQIDEAAQDRAMDLEYGTQTQAPKGTIRQFEVRAAKHADKAAFGALMQMAGVVL